MSDGQRFAAPELVGYRAERLIARGGMGEVYLAHDVRLGRPVALKLLAHGLADDDRFRDRLLRESRLAASLDHPNVIPIYEAGEEDGQLFIAMRYVRGGDLRTLLRRMGRLEPERAMAIAEQLAGALDAAHQAGLVHRDVKPSNVLLDIHGDREHCYLADFGLTQSVARSDPTDGTFMGTVAYVSPEQIRGDSVGGPADQYSLACLIFECLTGTAPYAGRSDVGAIFAHLEEPIPAATERAPGLPGAVDEVLARGMAKDPGDRSASCGELVAEATSALGLQTSQSTGRPRLLALLAAALVALAAAAGFALLSGGDEGRASPAAGGLVRIDPATNQVTARTAIRGHPGQIVSTPGGLWMADFRGGVLWRYEPGAGGLQRITSNGEPRDLAAVGDKVYVGADGRFLSGVVSRYDAVTGVREDGIDLLACAMAAGEGVVWAAGCPYVERLSTDGGRLRKLEEIFLPYKARATVETTRMQFRELAVGAGSLWVLGDALDRRLWRLDARTGGIQATIPLQFPPTSIAVTGGKVWVSDGVGDRLAVLDIRAGRWLDSIEVGRGASEIASGAGSVWVTNSLDGTVSRVEAHSGRVLATIDVGGSPRGVDVAAGGVWVTEHDF
jgi:predicted Ser/Thr protein kinase